MSDDIDFLRAERDDMEKTFRQVRQWRWGMHLCKESCRRGRFCMEPVTSEWAKKARMDMAG